MNEHHHGPNWPPRHARRWPPRHTWPQPPRTWITTPHIDCRVTPLWQLDCNRNPTSSPLPSLRDVGACNHNQQPLSARSNERGQGANKAEGEEEEGTYESSNHQCEAGCRPTCGVIASSCAVVRARRGRYDCGGAVCIPHTTPFTSPAALRAVWGSVYPTRHLVSPPSRSRDATSSGNAMILAPPPSLIDTSHRGGCLPHRAVDAVIPPPLSSLMQPVDAYAACPPLILTRWCCPVSISL